MLLLLAATATAQAQYRFVPPSIGAGNASFTLRLLFSGPSADGFDDGESFSWQGPTNPLPAAAIDLAAQFVSPQEFDLTIPASLLTLPGQATIIYHDSDGNSSPIPVSFTITAPPAPPKITTTSLPPATVGASYSVQLQATGGTGPLRWSVVTGSLPAGVALIATGLMVGMPSAPGSFPVTVKVTDSLNASDQKTFTLQVVSGPTAVDDVYAVVPGQTLIVSSNSVRFNDSYDPNTMPTWELLTHPSHGQVGFNFDGTFNYRSDPTFSGDDSFRYRLQTTVGSSDATVTIKVVGGGAAMCTITPPSEIIDNAPPCGEPPCTSQSFSLQIAVTFNGLPLQQAPLTVQFLDGVHHQSYRTEEDGAVSASYTPDRGTLAIGTYGNTALSDYPAGQTGPSFQCHSLTSVQPQVFGNFLDTCFCLFGEFANDAGSGCPDYLRQLGRSSERDGANPGGLALFRQFRDKILKVNRRGSDYANLYYRFRPELWRIFLTNPSLLWRSREVLERHGPLIRALLRGEKASISAADAKAVDELLHHVEDRASPELRRALAGIRRDIFDRNLLASFGLSLGERPDSRTPAELRQAFGKLPLHFETAPISGDSGYLARGPGYNIQLNAAESVLSLRDGSSVRMRLGGAAKLPRILPESPLGGVSNYVMGSNPKRWRTGVRHWARVRYRQVYPDVDMVYYGNQQQLEYDFIVAPRGAPDRIALNFLGTDRISTNSAGDLKIANDVYLRRPVAYQEIDGARRPVAAEYVVQAGNRVRFRIGNYDRSRALIIDPVLSYASLFGGSGLEFGTAIAVDGAGNAYVTGATTSANLQTSSATQDKYRGGGQFHADAYVTKFDPTGSKILYSTYFGGSDDDVGVGIAVDAEGNAYITGATRSADFPTVQPIQAAFGGAGGYFKTDAFLLKLDSTGSKVLYSTYLGGSGDDGARGIAIDSAGNVYVAGITSSHNFPTKNALQSANGGGTNFHSDGFVAKINAAGNALLYSTYLGGKGDDAVGSLAVDSGGNAYVTGFTYSPDFPLQNPLQKKYGGSADVFAAKLSPTGSALIYSTYLGGASDDFGTAIAVDPQGDAYLAGFTGSSSDFPVVKPAQPKFGSADGFGFDSFVAKLNPSGSTLLYSTFLGGSGRDYAYALAVDAQGSVYVAGETDSPDFATAGALQATLGGGLDAFLAKLNANGSAFEYRTYLGGAADDGVTALALDASGSVYLAGSAVSIDAPATFGAFQTGMQGPMDALVAKISAGAAPPGFSSVSAASLAAASGLAAQSIASGFGTGFSTQVTTAPTQDLPTALDGVSVAVKDPSGTERLAPLIFVSPSQINYVVPDGTQPGLAAVAVTRNAQTIASGVARVRPVAPTLFSANADGRGVAAAFALHVSADGSRSTDLIFQCGAAAGSCAAVPIDLGSDTDQVYLLLFGTGIRNLTTPATANVGGLPVPVLAAIAQGQFPGLDQVNVGPLPRSLAGKGVVDIVVTVDNARANTVTATIR